MEVNPPIRVGCYVVAIPHARLRDGRIEFKSLADTVKREFDSEAIEEPEEAPDTAAGAVLVLALHVQGALVDSGGIVGGFMKTWLEELINYGS